MNKFLEKIAEEYSEDRHTANQIAAGTHLFTGGLAAAVGNHFGIKPVMATVG